VSHYRIARSLFHPTRRPFLWPIHRTLCLVLAGVLLCGSGCGERDKISSYTVPKTQVAERVSQRMLAAMVPHQQQAWFFKVTGPDAAVESVKEPFRKLVESVSFDLAAGGQPDWTLPAEWTRQPGSGMRFATVQIPAEGKSLELTVIPLPMSEGDSDEYRLSNVNRWRNQVGLPPWGPQQMAENVEQLALAGGGNAILVDLLGEAASPGGPPMASLPMSPAGPGAGPAEGSGAGPAGGEPSGAVPTLSYDTPDGWEPGRVGGFRKAAFVVKDGEQQLEITVIDLAAAAGELLPNVNRWRGQVELPETTQQELDKELVQITIDGQPAVYIALPGPADAKPPRTILGAIQVRESQSWFFKLVGDSDLAEREKDRFQEFLKSVRFNAK
jgi:hypothetical protein